MSDPQPQRLSADEVAALKFAAHRQLTRWANRRRLTPQDHTRRVALISAVRALEHTVYADGCQLRPSADSE